MKSFKTFCSRVWGRICLVAMILTLASVAMIVIPVIAIILCLVAVFVPEILLIFTRKW